MTPPREITWGPRPGGYAVGARPASGGRVELLVSVPGAPALVLPMSMDDARALRRALLQSLRDLGTG